jgi:hypothetical protein
MTKFIKLDTWNTDVTSTIEIPEDLLSKDQWTDEDRAMILQHNHDKLDIYQLSQLDTEVGEFNDEYGEQFTAEEWFDDIIQQALNTIVA